MNHIYLKNRQSGLTLIELMIALTISLVLLSGILQVFSSSKKSYRIQSAMSRLQEDARFAMDTIKHDIRMVGFFGCATEATDIDNNLLDQTLFDPSTGGLEGTEGGGLNNSDKIVLQGGYGTGLSVTAPSANSANVKTVDNHGLQQGQIIMISDCETLTISATTKAEEGNGTIVMNTGTNGGFPENAKKPGLAYSDGDIFVTSKITYEIKDVSTNPPEVMPALVKNTDGTDITLAEGIENMQILYGEDTDGDGVANRYATADTAGLDMGNVVSVRISLLIQTTGNYGDNLTENPQTYTYRTKYAYSNITPTDNRIRRVFTTTVKLRNRGSS